MRNPVDSASWVIRWVIQWVIQRVIAKVGFRMSLGNERARSPHSLAAHGSRPAPICSNNYWHACVCERLMWDLVLDFKSKVPEISSLCACRGLVIARSSSVGSRRSRRREGSVFLCDVVLVANPSSLWVFIRTPVRLLLFGTPVVVFRFRLLELPKGQNRTQTFESN